MDYAASRLAALHTYPILEDWSLSDEKSTLYISILSERFYAAVSLVSTHCMHKTGTSL